MKYSHNILPFQTSQIYSQLMFIREASIEDIAQIQSVRSSVKENTLSDPNLVTDKDCGEFITMRGKGWVCEIENQKK